jgi:ADP-heptose:LPS heptosyltransferase
VSDLSKIRMISIGTPGFRYRRYNDGLIFIGRFLDILSFRRSCDEIDLSTIKSVLVLESHLIGDGVMTIAFLNTLKQAYPSLSLILAGQPWLRDLVPFGLVDQFVECRMPWVGPRKLSLKKWREFFRAAVLLTRSKPQLAMETRGDWRNFLFFWLLRIPMRLGSSATGGRVFLTHETKELDHSAPLWMSRRLLSQSLKIERDLVLPEIPQNTSENTISGPYVVLHPGASQPQRLMNQDQLLYAISKIKKAHTIIVAGGPNDDSIKNEIIDFIRLQGRQAVKWSGGIVDFLSICQRAEIVFTMDSGPAHLAAWSGASVYIFCNHDRPNIVRPLEKISYR